MTEENPLQPVNILKRGSRFSVVFAGGSQRFIKKADLETWKARVDAYWSLKDTQDQSLPAKDIARPQSENGDEARQAVRESDEVRTSSNADEDPAADKCNQASACQVCRPRRV